MKLKKILCIAMLVCLLGLVSCGNSEEKSSESEYSQVATVKLIHDEDFLGEWNSVAVKMKNGEEMTIDEVAKMSDGSADDYFCRLIVNADNTGKLEDSLDKFKGNWSCLSNELTFTSDGKKGWTFTFEDDGRITLPLEDGNKLILSK
ncbi:MAG: hypothetical protein NC177_09195 [Ruminococcus flavefaciens]|nr:hypothetical protein [Ruminococcus flavefaciens]